MGIFHVDSKQVGILKIIKAKSQFSLHLENFSYIHAIGGLLLARFDSLLKETALESFNFWRRNVTEKSQKGNKISPAGYT
jgi:hypothetical protein